MDAASRAYRIGIAALLVTSIGWAMNWPALKVLVREIPPLFARGLSGVAASILLALVAIALRQSLGVPRAEWGRLLRAAFTNVFVWMGFATLAIRWLSAGQGALLVYTMPAWATLFAWPVRGERPRLRAVTGLLTCFTGLLFMFGGQHVAVDRDHLVGAALALGSAIVFAFGTVAFRPPALPSVTLVAWQVGLGCLPMIPLGWWMEPADLRDVSATGWALMAYMTLVPMGICYLGWFAALRRLPASTAAIGTLLVPVIGVVASAALLGEPFGGPEIAALVLTVGGVALVLFRPAA